MHSASTDPGMTGRVRILEKMFYAEQLDIVGIQEGRFQEQQVVDSRHYTIFAAAGSNRGCYGVQIWISNELDYKLVATRIYSTRIMAVCISIGAIDGVVVIVSAHAPTSAAAEVHRDAFWDGLVSFVRGLQTMYKKSSVIMLIDSNGRVGSVASPAIGGCQNDLEDKNGMMLRQTAESIDVDIVNTFFDAFARI